MSRTKLIFAVFLSCLLFLAGSNCFGQELSADDYVKLGNSDLESELYLLALGSFTNALQIQPGYPAAIEGLNKIYTVISGKPEEEILVFVNAALQKYPDYSGTLHLALASIYQTRGLNAQALAALNNIKDKERISPYSADSLYLVKANAYLGLGEVSNARQELEGALQSFPDSSGIHSSLANVYSIEGENAKAIFHYQKALELNPDIADRDQIREKIESLQQVNSP